MKTYKSPTTNSYLPVVIFILTVVVSSLYTTNTEQYGDAVSYVGLANSFGEFFSLKIFYPETFRGYSFPFIIHLLNTVMQINLAIIALNSFLVTTIAFYIFPSICSDIFEIHNISTKAKLIFFLIIFYFWHGYFIYALTDFLALCFLLLAVIYFLRCRNIYAFMSGCFLAASFNARPIYQLNLLIFAILLVYFIFRKKYTIKLTALFASGLLAVSTPQAIINYNYSSEYSPFVQTSKFFTGNLYILQLYEGLNHQRYDTGISNTGRAYPVVYKGFIDNITDSPDLSNYWDIISSSPYNYIMTLSKHVFNGLDLKYSTPYIHDFTGSKVFSILNYLLLATTLYGLCLFFKNNLYMLKKQFNIKKIFVLANIFTPVILVIPVQIECRYFLPLYLLIYAIFINTAYKLRAIFKSKKNLVIFCIFIVSIVCYFINLSYHTDLARVMPLI